MCFVSLPRCVEAVRLAHRGEIPLPALDTNLDIPLLALASGCAEPTSAAAWPPQRPEHG